MIYAALETAIKEKCSDVHISAEGIFLRKRKVIEVYSQENIDGEMIKKFLNDILDGDLLKECMERLNNRLDFDFAFIFSGNRWRANISRYMKGYTLACRLLKDSIETIENLNLPSVLHKIKDFSNGLVLVTGATGSGKSTTLAAVLEEINSSRKVNIITIEDPVEYIYKPKKSRIIQKNVGKDVVSFNDAVVSAMRQDPDIILIGEMRELNTIRSAITLAETGHLVLATLHCKSVFEAVERIVGVFPAEEQEQVRVQFSSIVKMIIQQELVRSSYGNIVPINEIICIDTTFANMIKEHKNINNMRDNLRSKSELGNVHLVDNILWHISEGRLQQEDVQDILTTADMELIKFTKGVR